jgi:hypothetical protein
MPSGTLLAKLRSSDSRIPRVLTCEYVTIIADIEYTPQKLEQEEHHQICWVLDSNGDW